jgi:hypothetical protein
MPSNCYQVIVVKCHSNRHIFLINSKMAEILYGHSVSHQIISTFQWFSVPSNHLNFSVMQTLQWFSVSSNHLNFSVMHTLQWFSVSSHHTDFLSFSLSSASVCHQIIYTMLRLNMHSHHVVLELLVTGWAYIKTCPPAMHLQTTLAHHLFIYTLPTHYPFQNAHRPQLTIFLVLMTYGRRCWVYPDTDPSGYVGFYILIS